MIEKLEMPLFVHIADERHTQAIRRNGLKLSDSRSGGETYKSGVFALPIVDDFMLSHQWVRELGRRGHRTPIGVYFRVGDAELVWAGLFNGTKAKITASEAANILREDLVLGYEVFIPRSILASEISKIRTVPHVGWRFFPQAKGRPPFCLCKFCNRGEIKNRKMRERLDPNGDFT